MAALEVGLIAYADRHDDDCRSVQKGVRLPSVAQGMDTAPKHADRRAQIACNLVCRGRNVQCVAFGSSSSVCLRVKMGWEVSA